MKTKDHRDPSGPDMELERDLQSIRDGLASQGHEEPPAMLDQAVLNAARRDLEAKKRRPLRWVGTFATGNRRVVCECNDVRLHEDRAGLGGSLGGAAGRGRVAA